MIFKRHEIADAFAPHYAGAIVSAVVAAAGVAAQQAQAAAARRAAQQAAQQQKQNQPGISSGGNSVAGSLLGAASSMGGSVKGLVGSDVKPVAGASDAALPQLPIGQSASPMMNQGQQSMQQAFGGQKPDLQQLLQQLQTTGGIG